MTNQELLEKYLSGTCKHMLDACAEELKLYKEEGLDTTAKFIGYENHGDITVLKYWCNACEEEETADVWNETDWVYIGECPSEESTDLMHNSVHIKGLRKQMLDILKHHYGNPPDGAHIAVRNESGYRTLVCYYDTSKPLSVAYAYMAEDLLPEKWSKAALEYMETLK